MTPLTLLRSLGLIVRAEGGRLFASPRERLDADCRDYLRLHKAEILEELAAEESGRLDAAFQEAFP